jgi:hypothetical protein
VDPDRRRALCDFYREEFLRYFESLETGGFVNDGNRLAIERARQRFVGELDRLCCREEFPVLAETLLQNFDALTRLSERQPRQGH